MHMTNGGSMSKRLKEQRRMASNGNSAPTLFSCDRFVTKNKAIFKPTLKKIRASDMLANTLNILFDILFASCVMLEVTYREAVRPPDNEATMPDRCNPSQSENER